MAYTILRSLSQRADDGPLGHVSMRRSRAREQGQDGFCVNRASIRQRIERRRQGLGLRQIGGVAGLDIDDLGYAGALDHRRLKRG